MSARYESIKLELLTKPKIWLVTGAAGFIGSNLVEALLKLDQNVVALDNYATGHRHNLDQVRTLVEPKQYARIRMIEGDIRDSTTCAEAVQDVHFVLHQAALGSVPRSIDDPADTNSVNIDGFLNMLIAARDAGVDRFVYAASSSTYGDHKALPEVEDVIGKPLSPYAVTKYVNELYADVFFRTYGLNSIGLRYFNIFGRRQDPEGAYAAVIPKWTAAAIAGKTIQIYGDGKTSRDFCYIDNAVQANLLAATATSHEAVNQVYNVAVGDQTTLREIFEYICEALLPSYPHLRDIEPVYMDFRKGDVRHSRADIDKARRRLGYEPTHRIHEGLREAMDWYVDNLGTAPAVEIV